MKREKIMGTRRWFFWVSLGTVLILIYKFLDNFSGIGKWIGSLIAVLTPFLIAILLAYVLYIPCKKTENLLKKTKIKRIRGLSIAIVYIIVGIILFFVLKFIIPTIFSSIVDLVNNIQGYYNAIAMNELEESWAPFVKDNILKPVVEYIQTIDIPAMITQGKITEYLSSAMGFIKGIFNLFISLICSIYILSSREKIIKSIDRFAKAVMSVSGYKKFNRYFTEGNRIFFKFISSQVIDACVVSIIMTIALSIMYPSAEHTLNSVCVTENIISLTLTPQTLLISTTLDFTLIRKKKFIKAIRLTFLMKSLNF